MTEDSFILNHLEASNQDPNSTSLRAIIPSHLHEIRTTAEERLLEEDLAGTIKYAIPVYNVDGSLKASLLYKFTIFDWRFYWSGENSNSLPLAIETLNRQFFDLGHLYDNLWGTNFDFPLPIYTKVQITKVGRYFYQAGLVLGHTGRHLKVQTADGSIVRLRQQFTFIIDPNDTLPFGIPCY